MSQQEREDYNEARRQHEEEAARRDPTGTSRARLAAAMAMVAALGAPITRRTR